VKVKVVAYNGHIVLIPIEPEKDIGNGWYPTGGTRIGCVLLDTKHSLGVSDEAFELMRQIPAGPDAIGDLSWWACDDGTYAFSWFGAIHRVIDLSGTERARDFFVSDKLKQHCTMIPNDVPEAAKRIIDADPNATSWSDLQRIEEAVTVRP
jgi:hypothetical protein